MFNKVTSNIHLSKEVRTNFALDRSRRILFSVTKNRSLYSRFLNFTTRSLHKKKESVFYREFYSIVFWPNFVKRFCFYNIRRMLITRRLFFFGVSRFLKRRFTSSSFSKKMRFFYIFEKLLKRMRVRAGKRFFIHLGSCSLCVNACKDASHHPDRSLHKSYIFRTLNKYKKYRVYSDACFLIKHKSIVMPKSGNIAFLNNKFLWPYYSTESYFFFKKYLFSRTNSVFTMSPRHYFTTLLSLSINKVSPFINRNRIFVSQREVSFQSIYFFIEKNNFLYKNSYFLGILFRGKRGSCRIGSSVFNVTKYSFYKTPYAPIKYRLS